MKCLTTLKWDTNQIDVMRKLILTGCCTHPGAGLVLTTLFPLPVAGWESHTLNAFFTSLAAMPIPLGWSFYKLKFLSH